jgi:hypothetical protein
MSNLPASLCTWLGCGLALFVAVLAYRLGSAVGARRAHRLWKDWTGISPGELRTRRFDRELRRLRRDIGRPTDEWPEQTRED